MRTDRLENESSPAWEAAKTYFEMGPNERSLKAVGRKVGKNIVLMEKWSVRHKWVARARAWDEKRDADRRAAEEKVLHRKNIEWAERQANHREERYQTAIALTKKVEEMLKFPVVKTRTVDGKTIVEPAKWSMADAAKLAELADKLKAMALGVATDKTEISGPGGAPISTGQVVIIKIPDNGRDNGS